VNIGLLSQHADELGEAGTVLDAAQRATGLTGNKARALLGRFLFSGEEAEKPLAGLSGGERRRLALAVLVHSGANVLVLDEPTNHLDVDSREALEDALQAFAGSVLLVSHDRALLDAVGSRTIAIEDGRLRSYSGGWAEYLRVREARRESASRPATTSEPAQRPKRTREGPSKNTLRRREELEREIEAAEAALADLEDDLADPTAWADPDRAAESSARHAAARRAVDDLYAEWERIG
jgi:ATP-binding cassette subfamily F protein 3